MQLTMLQMIASYRVLQVTEQAWAQAHHPAREGRVEVDAVRTKIGRNEATGSSIRFEELDGSRSIVSCSFSSQRKFYDDI